MISIIIPVIRPIGLKILRDLIPLNALVEHEIVFDFDNKRIGCPKMVKQLVAKTKYDLVMFLGDDVIPQYGFGYHAVEAMKKIEWGLVGLNDMQTKNPTHWLAHKKLLPKIGGEFFHTGYKHNFCDNELEARARKLNRYIWCEEAKIYHAHPVFNAGEWDDDYKNVSESFMNDKKLFQERKILFDF